jgi:hypothetical protein
MLPKPVPLGMLPVSPPDAVVPYRLPSLPKIIFDEGCAPSAKLKSNNVVSSPAVVILKTVPNPESVLLHPVVP